MAKHWLESIHKNQPPKEQRSTTTKVSCHLPSGACPLGPCLYQWQEGKVSPICGSLGSSRSQLQKSQRWRAAVWNREVCKLKSSHYRVYDVCVIYIYTYTMCFICTYIYIIYIYVNIYIYIYCFCLLYKNICYVYMIIMMHIHIWQYDTVCIIFVNILHTAYCILYT